MGKRLLSVIMAIIVMLSTNIAIAETENDCTQKLELNEEKGVKESQSAFEDRIKGEKISSEELKLGIRDSLKPLLLVSKNMLTIKPSWEEISEVKINPKIVVERTSEENISMYSEVLADNIKFKNFLEAFGIKERAENNDIIWEEGIKDVVSVLSDLEYLLKENKKLRKTDKEVINEFLKNTEFIIPQKTSKNVEGYTLTNMETSKSEIVLTRDFSLIPDDTYKKNKMEDIILHEIGHVIWNTALIEGIDVVEIYGKDIKNYTLSNHDNLLSDWETNLEEDFAENFRIYVQQFIEDTYWTEKGTREYIKATKLSHNKNYEAILIKILNETISRRES